MESLCKPFLEGEKIYLRPLEVEDVEGNYRKWVNDCEIRKYMGTLHFPQSKHQLRNYVTTMINNPAIVFLAIVDKKNDQHIGNVKMGPIDWINRKAEYGRIIGEKDYWQQGIGTEVARLIVAYAFDVLNLNKITTSMSVDNKGSFHSNKKVGFQQEGLRKQEAYQDGQYRDVIIMGIVRDDYYANLDNY